MARVFRVLAAGLASCVLGGMMASADAAGVAEDRFETRVFNSEHGSLPYRLLRPKDYDAGQSYPLVIFYHGAGERGDDNAKQLVHGMNDFASDDVMAKYPCFVVAPQCPDGDQWVDALWSADAHTMPDKPTEPLRLSLELITSLQSEFSIDANRLYVTGLSMGGFGVWDAIQRYPKRFAAAVPICGGGDPAYAKQLAHIPVWAFHGADDGAVKPIRSRDMIAAMKAAGGSPKYTEYPGVGHNSWAATYANREMYAWLFAQKRSARE
ncbi:MAG: dienelactone hydrolase family protein [Planctomycetia bacterium]|nr:dienelactone hydrolase family protein [Planctomycetia bacterium]